MGGDARRVIETRTWLELAAGAIIVALLVTLLVIGVMVLVRSLRP